LSSAPNVNSSARAAMSGRRAAVDRRSPPIVGELVAGTRAGRRCRWARMDAVQAERAAEITDLVGTNRCSSQPRCSTTAGASGARRLLRQSNVRHLAQTSASFARISSGDSVEATKLNWPTGQTCLQNEAPANSVDDDRAGEVADDEPCRRAGSAYRSKAS
jgi:hypothetical protein